MEHLQFEHIQTAVDGQRKIYPKGMAKGESRVYCASALDSGSPHQSM